MFSLSQILLSSYPAIASGKDAFNDGFSPVTRLLPRTTFGGTEVRLCPASSFGVL
jgi:hypothetical protein